MTYSLPFLLSIALAAYALLDEPLRPERMFYAAALASIGLILWFFRLRKRPEPRWVVIDGSNVMHWAEGPPTLDTVAAVLSEVKAQGLLPLVWFDANVGYKVADRYLGPGRLARHLRLDERQVRVAPKGTPADPLLLKDARFLGAQVVTNDRYRDWAESHPMIGEPGFLVRGRLQNDAVILDLGRDGDSRPAPK